jgi:hypothetical protein
MAKSLGGSQKKKPDTKIAKVQGMKNGTKKTTKSKTSNLNGASNRFKSITERAKQIREKHPNMKWKNAIKQASSELF